MHVRAHSPVGGIERQAGRPMPALPRAPVLLPCVWRCKLKRSEHIRITMISTADKKHYDQSPMCSCAIGSHNLAPRPPFARVCFDMSPGKSPYPAPPKPGKPT
jgi:hypothetical protein